MPPIGAARHATSVDGARGLPVTTAPPGAPPATRLRTLQALFDLVESEIDERHRFLADLAEIGQLPDATAARVEEEIEARIGELRVLSMRMSRLGG
jgi:hypothetical protein